MTVNPKPPIMTMNPNFIFTPSDLARLRPLVSAETLAALVTIENGDDLPSVFTDASGEEIEFDTSSGIFLNEWASESGENIYQLGERVFVPRNVADLEGVFESDDIEDFFDNMDPGSATIEEYLAMFGVKPTLDVAERGYVGECRVWITHHYACGDMQAPYDTWAKAKDVNDDEEEDEEEDEDDEGDGEMTREFESYAAAQKWIKKAKDADHGYRSHGELALKEYTICKGWRYYV